MRSHKAGVPMFRPAQSNQGRAGDVISLVSIHTADVIWLV